MGHGTVSARALDVDAEPIGVGHALTGRARDLSRVDLAPDMRAAYRVDPIERAGGDHLTRADGDLLCRLEQQTHLPVKLVAHLVEDPRRAKLHGDMAIMAASVHATFVHRRVIDFGALGDGQAVHIAAQGDSRSRIAVRNRMRRTPRPRWWR